MKAFKLFAIVAMMAGVFTVSCNSDDDKVNPGDSESIWEGTDLIGNITGKIKLDPKVEYALTGTLSVKNGGTLTIPAGTIIKGTESAGVTEAYSKYIIVERGGQIFIQGTPDSPVVMSSVTEEPGAWGGLIINGAAPISGAGEVGSNQGSTEVNSNIKYGGNKVDDNSGEIQYLILNYTGSKSSSDKEHNGITLNGVGNGTTIKNIFVYAGADDGIEWFGGSVNVSNLLVVNSDDDMFDVTEGWSGTLDNAYGIWEEDFTSTEGDPRGIEADGNLDGEGPSHNGQSNFVMKNITIVNNATNTDDSSDENGTGVGGLMHDAIKIRRGAIATITNCVVKGSGQVKDLIDLSDKKGDAEVGCSIKLESLLTRELTGSEMNAGDLEENEYTVVKETNLTGCDTSVFEWTGYEFK